MLSGEERDWADINQLRPRASFRRVYAFAGRHDLERLGNLLDLVIEKWVVRKARA